MRNDALKVSVDIEVIRSGCALLSGVIRRGQGYVGGIRDSSA